MAKTDSMDGIGQERRAFRIGQARIGEWSSEYKK
jgi:hypothetical protein